MFFPQSSVNYDDVEPLTGRYVYVVHYFQPGGATVGVDFNVLGEFEGEGKHAVMSSLTSAS